MQQCFHPSAKHLLYRYITFSYRNFWPVRAFRVGPGSG